MPKPIICAYVSSNICPPFAATHGTQTDVGFKIYHETTLDRVEWNIINPSGETVRSGTAEGDDTWIGNSIPEDYVEGEYRFHVAYFSLEQVAYDLACERNAKIEGVNERVTFRGQK